MGFWSRCTVNDNIAMSEFRLMDTAVGAGPMSLGYSHPDLAGADPHPEASTPSYLDAFSRRLRCVRHAHVAALEVPGADGSCQASVAIFATLLGIAPATLLAYECGAEEPTAALLIRLRDVADASIDWLLTGADEA